MRDRQVELRGSQRPGQGGVRVAEYDDALRPLLLHDRLEALEYARRLHGLARGAHAEVEVGPRQVKVAEEDVGHEVVVVLAGVHEELGVALA